MASRAAAATARAAATAALGQTAAPGGLDQQHPTRVRHQRLAAGDHGQPGTQVLMLHPRSASQLDPMWSRQPTSNRAEQALSRIQGPRVTYKINLGESPRLGAGVSPLCAVQAVQPRCFLGSLLSGAAASSRAPVRMSSACASAARSWSSARRRAAAITDSASRAAQIRMTAASCSARRSNFSPRNPKLSSARVSTSGCRGLGDGPGREHSPRRPRRAAGLEVTPERGVLLEQAPDVLVNLDPVVATPRDVEPRALPLGVASRVAPRAPRGRPAYQRRLPPSVCLGLAQRKPRQVKALAQAGSSPSSLTG